MVTALRPEVKPGTSLKSLVNGFALTKQTEGKSPRTIEFYSENLKRFLWYASKQGWSDDIRMLTEWHIREFLGYVANEKCRWGLEGNGSETSQIKASHTTVHHYFVVLANFFGWVVRDGFLTESPTAKIKVANGYSPMLFSQNGYEVVCVPMLTEKANEQAKAEREAKQAETTEPEPEAEKPKKAKYSRKREKVAVA